MTAHRRETQGMTARHGTRMLGSSALGPAMKGAHLTVGGEIADRLERGLADAEKVIDKLEDKLTVSVAIAAAASGTPEQARAMASKMRAKAMRAAADGVDAAALESMVRDMERLARIAKENREREERGGRDASSSAISVLASLRI